jgi:hypothetical protein
MRKVSAFNLAAIVLGLVFLYLPIALGLRVGRLVDALVHGAYQ